MANKNKQHIKELLEDFLQTNISKHSEFPALDDWDMTPEEKKKLTHGEVLVMELARKALYGDLKALQDILDRVYGKAQQTITANVNTTNYVGFLEQIAENDPEALSDYVEAEFTQIPATDVPETGGSAGIDVAKDLGLFDED